MAWVEYRVQLQSDLLAEGQIAGQDISGDLTMIDTVSVMIDEEQDESSISEHFNELDTSVPETEYLPSAKLKAALQGHDSDTIADFYEQLYDQAEFDIISIEEAD